MIKKRKLRAMGYLGTLRNYKLVHKGTYVELYHWGKYGYCSQGLYYDWELIETVQYYRG